MGWETYIPNFSTLLSLEPLKKFLVVQGGGWCLNPILVFSLILSQAELKIIKTHWQYFPMIWCQHLKKKITGSEKRKFLFFLFNLFNYIFRLLNQTIFALKGMISQPFEGTKHHKTHKNQLNFCCIENNKPGKACLSWQCCTP